MTTPRLAAWLTAALLVAGACSTDNPNDAADDTGEARAGTETTPTSIPTTSPVEEAPPPEPSAVQIRLDHYAIEPSVATVPAGAVTVMATNRDRVPHDLVLIRTALAPDELPTSGIRVDETDPSIEVLARTPTLEPGEVGSVAASLDPGTYVLVCSVPHHYVREAMVATLTATA